MVVGIPICHTGGQSSIPHQGVVVLMYLYAEVCPPLHFILPVLQQCLLEGFLYVQLSTCIQLHNFGSSQYVHMTLSICVNVVHTIRT